jgi:hypothetical protein
MLAPEKREREREGDTHTRAMSASHFVLSLPKRAVYASLIAGGGTALLVWADPFHLRCGKRISGRFVVNVRKCFRPNLLAPPECVDMCERYHVIGVVCRGCGKVMHANIEHDTKDRLFETRVDGKEIWMTADQARKMRYF